MNNLYESLHKYSERWDENFLTEALVHFLNYLKTNDHKAFVNTLAFLIDESIENLKSCKKLIVESQFTIPSRKRPDICIRGDGVIALIEVKVEDVLGLSQISAYRNFLDGQKNIGICKLVTLTQYDESSKFPFIDNSVKWSCLSDWLDQTFTSSDLISRYLCEELVGFLNYRDIIMHKVEAELIKGIKAIEHFKQMLKAVLYSLIKLGEVGSVSRSSSEAGFHFLVKEPGGETLKLWFGIEYECPQELRVYLLESYLDINVPCDNGQIAKTGNWWNGQNLSSDVIHFFDLEKDQQLKFIEEFVRFSVSEALVVHKNDKMFKLSSSINH